MRNESQKLVICSLLGGKTKSTNLSWVTVGLGWVRLEFDKKRYLRSPMGTFMPLLVYLYYAHTLGRMTDTVISCFALKHSGLLVGGGVLF